MEKLSAVGYCRVSGETQIDKGGFPRQESAIEAWCAGSGVELLRVYREEGIAGKLGMEDRPAFQSMVADLLGNGCRTIVVESLDRLARQYDVQQQLATYLASKEIALISANTGEDITAALMGDPMRRAMVQIQGIFAELDKNLLISKLRKGKERVIAANGKCGGRDLYGVKPGEDVILARMRELRASGLTYAAIADELYLSSMHARSGKPWSIGAVAKILSR